jgi:GTPase KRas protein
LDILDTAGQDEYSQYQDQWMREGKGRNRNLYHNLSVIHTIPYITGILLVYAIDDRTSFQAAQAFKEKIDRIKENEKVAM